MLHSISLSNNEMLHHYLPNTALSSQDNTRQDMFRVNWLWFRIIDISCPSLCLLHNTKHDSRFCLLVAFRQSSKMFALFTLFTFSLLSAEVVLRCAQNVCHHSVCQELPVCHRNWLTLPGRLPLKMCQIHFVNPCPSLNSGEIARKGDYASCIPDCCRCLQNVLWFLQKCACIAPWARRASGGGAICNYANYSPLYS